jgi:hypothetical protein
VSALIAAAAALAVSQPRTSGNVGFVDGNGVQAQVSFDVRQNVGDTACGTYRDIRGSTTLSFVQDGQPGVATHDVTFTQPTVFGIAGSGGFPAGGPHTSTWHISSGGFFLGGADLDLTLVYDTGAVATTVQLAGTLAADGSMSGTWSDNAGHTGTWTTPARNVPTRGDCATGSLTYSDANGTSYTATVLRAYVSGSTAYFGGVIRDASAPSFVGGGVVVQVSDNGEPGKGHDTIDIVAPTPAISVPFLVAFAHSSPASTIDSGNIQVR